MKISGDYVIDTGFFVAGTSYFNVRATVQNAQDADDLISALRMFKTILKDIAASDKEQSA
jgi:hypothetical protein